MPQLDSLRALAFFGVALSHWLPDDSLISFFGGTGVQLFFVLSGFLITGILLDYRRVHEGNASLSAGAALRIFYARRFFRIFPLFYAVIAAALILDIGPIRQLWPWHVLYASNYLYAIDAPLPGDPFTHFWTLGVEEQFYLIWPFLVFFLPLPALKRLTLGLLFLAPAFRIGMEYTFPELHRVNYLPPSCADSLGVGAALAFAARDKTFLAWPASTFYRTLGLAGMLGGVATSGVMLVEGTPFWLQTLGHTSLVLVYGWAVFGAAQRFGGLLGRVLDRPELQFLGKISYGLYVFHHFFTHVDLNHLFGLIGIPAHWADSTLIQLFSRGLPTLLLAVASWYLYEKPLNNLKRYFTLRRKMDASPSSPRAAQAPLDPSVPREVP